MLIQQFFVRELKYKCEYIVDNLGNTKLYIGYFNFEIMNRRLRYATELILFYSLKTFMLF